MEPAEIQERIQRGLPGTEVHVRGDGSHFEAVVVGEVFAGQSALNRQRLVYGTLSEPLASGAIHALTIKAHTPDEWEKAKKLKVS